MKIGKVGKLVLNLKDNKMYVVHIKNLDQVLKIGLKKKKLYQNVIFEKSYWMKPYMML